MIHSFLIFSCCSGLSLRHYSLLSHILLLFRTFSSLLSTSIPYSLAVQDLLFGIIHFFPIFSCCSGPSLRHYPLLSCILLLFRTFSSLLSTSIPYSLAVQDLLFGIIHFFPVFSCCSGLSLHYYPLLSHILLLFRTFSSALFTSFSYSLFVQGFFSSALSTSFPCSLVVQDLLLGISHFFSIFSCCSGPSLRHYPLFPYSLVVQVHLCVIIHFFPIFSCCSGPSLRHYPLLSHNL